MSVTGTSAFRMLRHLSSPALPLLLVAGMTAACSSCSSKEQATDQPADGGADVTDAHEDHYVSDAKPTDARADRFDAASDHDAADTGAEEAGPGGPVPKWEKFGEIEGVVFSHLANASKLRAFRWTGKPVQGIEHSEVAEFLNINLTGYEHKMGFNVSLEEHGSSPHFGVEIRGNAEEVLFTDGDGYVLEGIRCRSKNSEPAGVLDPAIWKNHFAVDCAANSDEQTGLVRGVVGDLNQPASSYRFFSVHSKEVPELLAGFPSFVMGDTRLGFRWAPHRVMGTFDLTGGDLHVMDTMSSDGVEIDKLNSTGNYFLWSKATVVNGKMHDVSMYSDGLQPGKQLLQPPTGTDDGSIYNADTHLGWLRGSGMESQNSYSHVELWASKFNGDPTNLTPYKVGDVPNHDTIISFGGGGWGHWANAVYFSDKSAAIQIWNLEKKTSWQARVDPGYFLSFAGLTKTHVWVLVEPPHADLHEQIVRFPLEPPSQ